jgi:hypothetical protein
MASNVSLGVFRNVENVHFRFQFQDFAGALTTPTSAPVFKLYFGSASGSSIITGVMASGDITGQYVGTIDIDDYDGAASVLPDGRYFIEAYTADAGISNHSFYTFQVAEQSDFILDNALYAFILFMDQLNVDGSGSLRTAMENYIWNADPADHAAADTFAARTFTEDNLADILLALSVGAGYTTDNDLATLKTKADTIEAVSTGRWEIDPIAKQLTFYELNGTTVLAQFNLRDSEGELSTTNVHEREPV